MDQKVSVVLVGISGYGNIYLNELLHNNENTFIQGVVDIKPEQSNYYNLIAERGIPIFKSLEEFYMNATADLAIISTPIHFHKKQSCYAMSHGSNVLCEKPISGNPDDIDEMIKIRNQTGKFLSIGFNWSFTDSVQLLKQDILNGMFGQARRMKSLVLWPRDDNYYSRSPWAGKKYSVNGDMIFDSIANNATSHFLHHMFYLLGATTDSSCKLRDVTAELYRANDIETFDTCAVRLDSVNQTEILFYASHAIQEELNPRFKFEFELATIVYNPDDGKNKVVAHFNDGTTKVYSNPEDDHLAKLRVCVNAILNGDEKVLCGPEAAVAHAICIKGMHESVPQVPKFPTKVKKYNKDIKQWQVTGLERVLMDCYDKWTLPSESKVTWAKKGKQITLT
ncbi:Gfo/Idh/MocA family protein [Virgibacillus sp. FSP13]